MSDTRRALLKKATDLSLMTHEREHARDRLVGAVPDMLDEIDRLRGALNTAASVLETVNGRFFWTAPRVNGLDQWDAKLHARVAAAAEQTRELLPEPTHPPITTRIG